MQRPTKEDESKSPEKFAQHEYEIRERYFRNSNDPSRSNSSFLPPNPSNIPWQYHNFATAGIELRPPFEATTNYYYHHPQLHALAASPSQPQEVRTLPPQLPNKSFKSDLRQPLKPQSSDTWRPIEQPQQPQTQSSHHSHFQLGSLIQLATGELKRVENLSTEDFLRSAKTSSEVKIDQSVVTSIDLHVERGVASIAFLVGQEKVQVAVEATLEHPFYVVGQGWSSAIPERTLIKFQLPCNKLKAGDVCISLSHCNRPPTSGLDGGQELKMMRPPPVPTLQQQERRRSNSASPSDKLLLKRAFAASTASTASTASPLASKRFPNSSPTKQVAFEEPLIKRPKSDQK